jgi:hypothetical protein
MVMPASSPGTTIDREDLLIRFALPMARTEDAAVLAWGLAPCLRPPELRLVLAQRNVWLRGNVGPRWIGGMPER